MIKISTINLTVVLTPFRVKFSLEPKKERAITLEWFEFYRCGPTYAFIDLLYDSFRGYGLALKNAG